MVASALRIAFCLIGKIGDHAQHPVDMDNRVATGLLCSSLRMVVDCVTSFRNPSRVSQNHAQSIVRSLRGHHGGHALKHVGLGTRLGLVVSSEDQKEEAKSVQALQSRHHA